jgi:hypothetical protein
VDSEESLLNKLLKSVQKILPRPRNLAPQLTKRQRELILLLGAAHLPEEDSALSDCDFRPLTRLTDPAKLAPCDIRSICNHSNDGQALSRALSQQT